MEPELLVRPATAADVDAVERLFGKAGASNGCWCQYWLLGTAYKGRRAENRRDLAEQLGHGDAGSLALRGSEPLGWVRTSRRSTLPWLTRRFARQQFPNDDPWVLSCFFVARHARDTGVMRALLTATVARARAVGETVEGFPVDPAIDGATANRFPGVLPAFLDAGFTERGRVARDRAYVRLDA